MNWYPPEFDFIFNTPHYWGPGTTDFEQPGINDLDRIARAHDLVYRDASYSHQGSVQRAKADYQMAFDSGPGITGLYMLGQASFRVLTFNQLTLPWD